ncbi:MAG: hypothetical protein AAGF13_02710 [Pseudomonadota bacterium]
MQFRPAQHRKAFPRGELEMNIGSPAKLLQTLNMMDPKELSKLTAAMKKDQKDGTQADSTVKKLSSSFKELEKLMGQLNAGINDVSKAAIAKAKPSSEDKEKMKKDAAKLAETWRQGYVKHLETKIAEAEKELQVLKSWLASTKKAKPSGWFM